MVRTPAKHASHPVWLRCGNSLVASLPFVSCELSIYLPFREEPDSSPTIAVASADIYNLYIMTLVCSLT